MTLTPSECVSMLLLSSKTYVVEDISTGQILLNETRPEEALDKEQMTAERALNHCAREARNLIDGGHKA